MSYQLKSTLTLNVDKKQKYTVSWTFDLSSNYKYWDAAAKWATSLFNENVIVTVHGFHFYRETDKTLFILKFGGEIP